MSTGNVVKNQGKNADSTVANFRIPKDLDKRLGTVSSRLDLSKNDLARHAIRALVEAIEQNNYSVIWPPKMHIEGDIDTISA